MRYVAVIAAVALLLVVGFVVLARQESDADRVESQIEARLGGTTDAECDGEENHWLCDIYDEALQRDYSGCSVRLDDAGRIASAVERCKPK